MIQPVKRLLIILMLLALPLQFSWAAAAVYCQHEEASTTQHFGHHEHKHDAEADQQIEKSSLSKLHKDCGYCHAVSQASFLMQTALLVIPTGSVHAELQPPSFSSHIPDGPRRPDRHPVA